MSLRYADGSLRCTVRGGYRGGGRQDLLTPLRFQNSFSVALKGKKT